MEKLYYQTQFDGSVQFTHEADISEELKAMTIEELEQAGWGFIEYGTRPTDSIMETYDLIIQGELGSYQAVWTGRPKTNEELIRDEVSLQIELLNNLLGTGEDVGTTTLRGLKGVPNAEMNAGPAKYIKALTGIVIELVQAERRSSQMIVRKFDNVL